MGSTINAIAIMVLSATIFVHLDMIRDLNARVFALEAAQ